MASINEAIQKMYTTDRETVYQKSLKQDVILVFLRHFGCTFCREALEELHDLFNGHKFDKNCLILVHMSTEDIACKYFERYGLSSVPRVSDPDCLYYKEFGLLKGTFNQLFGFRSWLRGIEAGLIKGHGFGTQLGDGFQMPGVFIIQNGLVTNEFRHKFPSDKPDYLKLMTCPQAQ